MKIKFLIFIFCFKFSSFCFSQSETSSDKPADACHAGWAYNFLDINNIKTLITSASDMGWNLFGSGTNCYYFPKGSTKNAGGASALWIGGLDQGGQLKVAAMTYRQNGNDFWPGPLDTLNISTDGNVCSAYDGVWKVDYKMINEFLANQKAGNIAIGTYTISPHLSLWPWLDTINSFNRISRKLAPYRDVNNNGKYELINGDYPKIKGDQTLYTIYNDKGDIHTETNGQSIGLEIHQTSYAYGCPSTIASYPELNNATFYHYRIAHRSTYVLKQVYVSFWTDVTIGDGSDDFVGSNPNQRYGFAYNGSGNDNVYGNLLPATGVVLLKGPPAPANDGIDNNGNGSVDEANEEILKPNIFYYIHRSNPSGPAPSQQFDPDLASHYYGYITGYWKDGLPFTCGDSAYGGAVPTKHVFPDNNFPGGVCGNGWSEMSAGNRPGNRCMLVSAGPFTLQPQSEIEFEIAIVTSLDSTSIGNTQGSINKLAVDIQKIKNFYAMPVKPTCIDTVSIAKKIVPPAHEITVFPNPVEDELSISFGTFANTNTTLTIYDPIGKILLKNDFMLTESTIIDMKSFSKGVYIVEVTAPNYRIIKKIIKQ